MVEHIFCSGSATEAGRQGVPFGKVMAMTNCLGDEQSP